MADFQKTPPLDWQTPIVKSETGTPTPQFIRLWQTIFQNTDGTIENIDQLINAVEGLEDDVVDLQTTKADKSIVLTAGVGLSGGGDLSANRVFNHDDSTVTPGSYTNANITVDAQGHVTAAANGSGGGGGGLTLIGSNVFAGSTNSYTFASIPGTYSSLMLITVLRGGAAATAANVGVRFNGDSGANYIIQIQDLVNTTTSGTTITGATNLGSFGVPADTAPVGAFNRAEFSMPGYAMTVNQKRMGGLNAYRVGNGAGNIGSQHHESEWLNTAAVTDITVFDLSGSNFIAGSTLWLYGVP